MGKRPERWRRRMRRVLRRSLGQPSAAVVASLALIAAPLLLGYPHAADAWADRSRRQALGDIVVRLAPPGALVGVHVADVATGEVLYARAPHVLFAPASTQALLVAGMALHVMGPEHRFETRLAADAPPRAGRVRGALYLIGGGDPTLAAPDLAALARDLRARGVRVVDGDLVADAGLFERDAAPAPGLGWEEAARDRAAPLTALGLAGAPAGGSPPRQAAAVLAAALAREGVVVRGGIREGRAPYGVPVLAAHRSAPLALVVRRGDATRTAETLLRHLGAMASKGPGSREKGVAALRTFLEQNGWPRGGFRLVDGAGRSRQDAVSPTQLTRFFRTMARFSHASAAFEGALPLAGLDRPAAPRLAAPDARGAFRGAIGTAEGGSCLAGYVRLPDGRDVAIAVMVHGAIAGPAMSRRLQEELVAALARPD